MTDALDDLVRTADPLLRRVDEVLGLGGAPAEHRVWAELRRVRLLPGDAVQAVAALRPHDLADAAPELRADAQAYAEVAATALRPPTGWSGTAAEAYADRRHRVADRLGDGPGSLAERLTATARLADALTGWMARTRQATADMLTEVLTSAEAVDLAAAGEIDPAATRETQAAATIAVRVLRTVADSYEQAFDLISDSRALAEADDG